MLDNQENDTKYKINTIINSIQNKINKRAGYNLNNQNAGSIDINTFQSFGAGGMQKNSEFLNSQRLKGYQHLYPDNNNFTSRNLNPKFNNYINDYNHNNQYMDSNEGNFPMNEFYIRKLIKDEFADLILPYQKDSICNSNLMETKLNDIEKKFQIIINAQNMGNLNDNAKIISTYLCSNISNDNFNKDIEKLKTEYDSLFDGLQKKIDSLNNQINMQKINNDSSISNIAKKMENIDKKINEMFNKEIKIYVEENTFKDTINKIIENQKKIKNDNESNIINLNNQIDNNFSNINSQIDNITNSLNQYKYDTNNYSMKINGLSNDLNSLRSDFGAITEDLSQVKYQITPEIINKINSIDLNSLKQQISPNEFKNLKDNMNIFDTNLNSIKTMAENSDRSIYDLKKLINSVEEKQNLSNKNIDKIQPLLNENITDKIKTLDNKIEELSKKIINIENINKDNNNNENKDDINNKEEKKEEETGIFSGGSRRQQRNNKNANKSVNNNLDENTLNLIKQLEKINLNELQKIDFNNILLQINDINNENKILSNKIEAQNKEISLINEKIKNFQNNNSNLLLNKNNLINSEKKNEFKSNIKDFNDPFKREPEMNNININKKNVEKETINNVEKDNNNDDEYDDDFDNDFDDSKDKDKEENPLSILEDKNKKNDIFENKNNFNNDDFNKKGSKNEYGSFDKYEETNILDQIMGLGGSRRNNDFDKNINNGGTFLTGSLTASKNNNINPIDVNPIYDDINIKKSQNKELNNNIKEEEKERENNSDIDDFDDFDVEEI